MKTSLVLLMWALSDYRSAVPGYKFSFPRDHFDHPEFRTEWWYYTGNLRSADGRRFGYELTFFRHAIQPNPPAGSNIWDVRDVWMAHFALSDIDGNQFFHTERLNRSGPGIAGVDAGQGLIWNGNWSVKWSGDDQKLNALANDFEVDLTLRSVKPPVVHGTAGISRKAAGPGRASHYISLTRLITKGGIKLGSRQFTVEGLSWMDHEFFSHSLESNQAGWDWFSLQFNNGSELMLYRLRRKDGTVEPYSSGTYIDPSGRTRSLRLEDFSVVPGGAKYKNYPIEWSIQVPSLSLMCHARTRLPQQELTGQTPGSPTYWEGAIDVAGTQGNAPIHGAGYLEMTGYASQFRIGD